MLSRTLRHSSKWSPQSRKIPRSPISWINPAKTFSQQVNPMVKTPTTTERLTTVPASIVAETNAHFYSDAEAPQFGFTEGSYNFARYFLVNFPKTAESLTNANQILTQCEAQGVHFRDAFNGSLMVGFTPALWNDLAVHNGLTDVSIPCPGTSDATMNLINDPALNNGGFNISQNPENYWMWIQVKSNNYSNEFYLAVQSLTHTLENTSSTMGTTVETVDSMQEHNAVVLDHFQDGYSNPTSKAQLRTHVLNDDGSSYGLFQEFEVKFDEFSLQRGAGMEETIGRTMNGELSGGYLRCAHNRRNRIIDPLTKLPVSMFRVAGSTLASNAFPTNVTIAFNAFANSMQNLEAHVDNMLGKGDIESKDQLLSMLEAQKGGYYYIPGAKQLSQMIAQDDSPANTTVTYPQEVCTAAPIQQMLGMNRSSYENNPYLFFSSRAYMHEMSAAHGDQATYDTLNPPSYRVLKLLGNAIDRWHNGWYFRHVDPEIESLTYWLDEMSKADSPASDADRQLYQAAKTKNDAGTLTIMERKGLADKLLLSRVYSYPEYVASGNAVLTKLDHMDLTHDLMINDPANSWSDMQEASFKTAIGTDTFRIEPNDLLAGTMPDFGLGRGKRSMPYIYQSERADSAATGVDESGEGGHIVPNHKTIVAKGIRGILDDIQGAKAVNTSTEQQQLYDAMTLCWEGVAAWFDNHSKLAIGMLNDTNLNLSIDERKNLQDLSDTCLKCMSDAPTTFREALQLVYGVHCCLHLLGDLVSVGRLDTVLGSFYDSDVAAGRITMDEAQELLDAFWIKMSDKLLLNREKVKEYQTMGTTAITGRGGNFDQGGGLNQWVQQVTVGGSETDGSTWNDVTMMCLKSARRLPVNAPCLSLRIPDLHTTQIPNQEAFLEETTKAIMSGGAHPILFNDSRILQGLMDCGIPAADVGEWACDGCYEPMIAGQSKFFFMYVWPLMAVEYALNEGCDFLGAGSEHLRGNKMSYPTRPVEDWYQEGEEGWQIFLNQFELHMKKLIADGYTFAFADYQNTTKYSPSPMLSSLVDGCLDSGRDYTDNGAKYNIFSHFYQGMSVFVDSMYAIKKLAFDPDRVHDTEVLYFKDLAELRDCLKCNWGYNMTEPNTFDPNRSERSMQKQMLKFRRMRERALGLTRFGMGWPMVDASTGQHIHNEVDALAHELMGNLVQWTADIKANPVDYSPGLAGILSGLEQDYGTFDWVSTPGVGNFEGYCGTGAATGASADGRLSQQAYASDGSPSPVPSDLDPIPQRYGQPLQLVPNSHYNRTFHNLFSWNSDPLNKGLSNAVPVDCNVREDVDPEKLKAMITEFSRTNSMLGSSLLTITCADPDTYSAAQHVTDGGDLLRVRQGGWSEHYCVLWDAHKNQHRRRPFFYLDDNIAALRWTYDNPSVIQPTHN